MWRTINMCIYITKPLCCTLETNTTLLIHYTPLQKSKKKEKRWLLVKEGKYEKSRMNQSNPSPQLQLSSVSCTAVPQIWCGESSFPPWRLPVSRMKDFVIACGQAWKITHRFLTRSWTPLVLIVISKESTCMHTYPNTCTHCRSVTKLCSTLCNPMNCSMLVLPVLHYFLKFAQTHVHWVGDAIQPSHPLSLTSPPALNLSQHQGLFQWVGSSHQVAKVLELQLQHQSFW